MIEEQNVISNGYFEAHIFLIRGQKIIGRLSEKQFWLRTKAVGKLI